MANIFGAPKAGGPNGADETRTVPTGDSVGSYTSYLDAQKAVDYLADQQFPVHMVSIVGNELKMVERVTGRLSYPRVALSGALSGMWFGLFVGVMLSFFAPSPGYFSIVTSVLMGAAFFMLFGIVTYAMQRGKRDFTSTSQVVATTYDVVVSQEAAFEARRLLQQLPMTRSDAAGHGAYPQRDYQQQPYQQNPSYPPYRQPGQQATGTGQGPARPGGWNDPYGQRSGSSAPEDQGHAAPPQHNVQQTGDLGYQQNDDGGAAPQPSSSPVRPVTYPDLPDGRPQYGVRLPQAPAAGPQAGAGQAAGHQPPADDQAGDGRHSPEHRGEEDHSGDRRSEDQPRPGEPRQ